MPYIRKEAREALDRNAEDLVARPAVNAGELNYQITKLISDYVVENGLNYQRLNDVVGALDGAKAEFQRRVVAPYEDTKIRENGDVYPSSLLGG